MGSELPLFCIHGLYGDMFYFLDLARELGPDRPVYGLQAVGLDGSQPRHTTVQQMAEHYAREIRSVQPDGPYHLAGASLGGWIAHAVAQELVRQKCTVASLSLLDTRASANVPWHVYARVMAPQLAGRMIFHLQRFVNGPTRGRAAYLKEKLSWFRLHLTRSRKSLPVRPLTPNPAPLNSHDFAIDHFEAVVMKYRPEKYPGDVTVFAGADAKYFRHAFFWKQFVTGKVRVQTVNGDHGSLIGPEHAPEFARRFAKILDQAETEAGGFSHRK